MKPSVYKKHHHGFVTRIWFLLVRTLSGNLSTNSSNRGTKVKFKLGAAIILVLCFIASLVIYHAWEAPLVSPLTNNSWISFTTHPQTLFSEIFSTNRKRIVYGFLPYWNLEDAVIQPEVTHLSYFGLNIAEDGSIETKDADGNTHPGYRHLNSDKLLELANQVNQTHNQFELTLVQFDADTIVKIANDPQAHDNLIQAIDSMLLSYPISGINIDIEYGGALTDELRENFASMIEKIANHLNHKFDDVTLSIDMYASASNNRQLWDVPRIGQAVDYIVVMAYDFHLRGSPQAGPVAPLFGGKDRWDTDIHQHLREFLRYVPKNKLLLGIPFYGYGWQTDSRSQQANSYPNSGFTATYSSVQELLENKNQYNVQTGWDDLALCPYLSYEKEDKTYMIYYEDVTSIKFKLEYVKQLDLAGIAIWALGYEGPQRDLWDVVSTL
ncbi:MAG: Glycoside hydrolase family 18 [Microgenomates bacterium 39_7]|nr:MAG: Glycoside hydrolase family 18 [Microgenomates bacterium 39_7]